MSDKEIDEMFTEDVIDQFPLWSENAKKELKDLIREARRDKHNEFVNLTNEMLDKSLKELEEQE